MSNPTKAKLNLRPKLHFTAPEHWLNDPNGIIYWKGKYHLFYQHNPFASVWGNIHWGHASSEDLVHWKHHPIALAPTPDSPDERGVWSGCTLIHDGKVYAFYTGVRGERFEDQTVCLAISEDEDLLNWEKYEGNPLITGAPEEFSGCGFRDPYIFRESGTWKMVIGAGVMNGGEAVLLYQSQDLLHWEYVSPLIVSDVQHTDIYECPAFFPMGDKWVLLAAVMPMKRVDYFVGIFWNNHFIVETNGTLVDAPFYAPYCFSDGNGRRLMMGWIQEARPQSEFEQAEWAGAMSMPLELMLLENNQLALTPVREVLDEKLASHYCQYENVQVEDLEKIQAEMGQHLKMVISDDLSKVLFVDGSVVEFFNFPHYRALRSYDGASLNVLKDLVEFPIKRLGVWTLA